MTEMIFYCIRHKDRLAEYLYNGNSYCKECMGINMPKAVLPETVIPTLYA